MNTKLRRLKTMIWKLVNTLLNERDTQEKRIYGNQWNILETAKKLSGSQNIHWKKIMRSLGILISEDRCFGSRSNHIINQRKIKNLLINIVELRLQRRHI